MIIQASGLVGLLIISRQGEPIGQVDEIIINHLDGKLLGFKLRLDGLFKKLQVVSESDVIAFHRRGIIINSGESVVLPEEIVRIKQEMESKIIIIGAKALTESRKKLGRVVDILINTESGQIIKYYIESSFSGKRIIPSDNVLEITKEGVIFTDSIATQTSRVSEIVTA